MSLEGDSLAISRTGRFRDPAIESAFQAWHVEQSLPFTRAGLLASILNWIGVTAALPSAAPDVWREAVVLLWMVQGPPIVAALLLSRDARRHAWLVAVIALLNASSGLVIIRMTELVGMPDLAVPGVSIIAFFGFAVFRLPPAVAAAAVGSYVLWAIGGLALAAIRGDVGVARVMLDFVIVAAAYQSGVLTNVAMNRASRSAFRQERIIETQRATIARQQELLEKELSHQVAERSRELGAVLAKSDVTLDVRALKPGERFAERYKILASLGAGGMGAVYEVERVTDAQRLALKCVVGEVSGASAARFAREAEIGARVRHPSLISIVDVGVSTGVPFLVMELVKGGSLEAQRSKFGDVAWALPILRQIAEGLAALHDAGVVHRDLKPANVLLADDVAKISDFGISRFGSIEYVSIDPNANTMAATPKKGADLTATNMVLGTPLYMAPEGAKTAKALDASADVFAYGIIAYEMLTGRSPFAVPAFVLAMAEQPIPSPAPVEDPRVPEPLRAAIVDCLQGDPAKRPKVRAVLGQFSAG